MFNMKIKRFFALMSVAALSLSTISGFNVQNNCYGVISAKADSGNTKQVAKEKLEGLRVKYINSYVKFYSNSQDYVYSVIRTDYNSIYNTAYYIEQNFNSVVSGMSYEEIKKFYEEVQPFNQSINNYIDVLNLEITSSESNSERYNKASTLLQYANEFKQSYSSVMANLADFLQEYKDNTEYLDYVTLKIDYNGGTRNGNTFLEVTNIVGGKYRPMQPSKEGFAFNGWEMISGDGSVDDKGIYYFGKENAILRAKWTLIENATAVPTGIPTQVPTAVPTGIPTQIPTAVPTEIPTQVPTTIPTGIPTQVPTAVPTQAVTGEPIAIPTAVPTQVATGDPIAVPTAVPTQVPTGEPTAIPTQEPTNFNLTKTNITLSVGETTSIGASANNVVYQSADSKIAIVDASGKVLGMAPGKTVIIASVNGVVQMCTVTVKKASSGSTVKVKKKAPTKITVKVKAKTLRKGKKYTIKYTLPKNSIDKVTFKSSNKKIATVNSKGVVKAKKKGTAKVTVKTYNGKKAIIKIVVK